jgi:cytochrome c-type biogenesis protein CcsB
VVGTDAESVRIVDLIATHRELGTQVVGIIGHKSAALTDDLDDLWLGEMSDAESLINIAGVSGVVISPASLTASRLNEIIRNLQKHGVHVFVATLGTGFFAVGGGLSVAQLLQTRREAGGLTRVPLLATFPTAEVLENIAYRVIVIGFAFWTFTLMAGAIWAERAWGRYWGWDTKEVWTFIIWVTFAGYIHARATRGWRGSRSAWLAIIGFTAVMFNFTVVNLFFKGLHAYTGL